ncbi:MAG: YhdH/YhfP family quinone oxidoreductase [Bacteroidetes bacterium]|nr:YhdH/YhfP family quinone oxidoreductase [Bacteroidota bacterium]
MDKEQLFKAFVVSEIDGKPNRTVAAKKINELPENDIIINVKYSSLNYKDALSANCHKGVTRHYPHTPGIDSVGVVVESKSDKYKVGDEVICMGYDLGMNTPGGYGEYISVPEGWVMPLPKTFSMRDAMIIGTAGFTAAIGVNEIISAGITPDDGQVLVTGATGGVGIFAVAMLSKLGFDVTASSGKKEKYEMLERAGAKTIIGREEVNDTSERGLLKSKWIAAFDTVGGNTLSTVLKSIKYGGVVTNCGNVASIKLDVTIFPFILRSVRLIGIAAAETPMDKRINIWKKLENELRLPDLEYLVKEVNLENLNNEIELMLAGKQFGRVLVKL